MTITLARITFLLTAAASPVFAQNMPMSGPPPVLQIQRELVKPGKAPAHNKWEAGWPAAFGKANWSTNYIAMNAVSGINEAWFLIGYPSFDAFEKDNAAIGANAPLSAEMARLSAGESEFVENTRTVLAQYIPELSYQPGIDLSKMRYFEVLTYAMKPGHDEDFAKAAAMYREGYTKGTIDSHWAAYRVVSGLPAGTFLVFVPLRSLSTFDKNQAEMDAMSRALGPDQMGALGKLVTDGVASYQSQIFAFSPKMSYVNKQMKTDPFWR